MGTNVARRATALRTRNEVPRRKSIPLLDLSRCYSSAVISFSGFPEHWIIFHQVCNTIAWRFARSYSRRSAVSTVKLTTTKVTNNSSAPCAGLGASSPGRSGGRAKNLPHPRTLANLRRICSQARLGTSPTLYVSLSRYYSAAVITLIRSTVTHLHGLIGQSTVNNDDSCYQL